MERVKLEGRGQLEALQEELASSQRRNSELEGQVAGAEERIALLRGEQDAICADAFQLGEEEIRSKISREHPEWDLSFLEAGSCDAGTPGAEPSDETEYGDFSDVEEDAQPGAAATVDPGADGQESGTPPCDAKAPKAHQSVAFEVVGPSNVSAGEAAGDTGSDPKS